MEVQERHYMVIYGNQYERTELLTNMPFYAALHVAIVRSGEIVSLSPIEKPPHPVG